MDKATKEEVESTWKGSYEEVMEEEVLRRANVIRSHTVYKFKVEEGGGKLMKERLCPHRNRDKMRLTVRKDSATGPLDVIRMMLIIYSFTNLRLGCIDTKSTYLQSGPITLEICPPASRSQLTTRSPLVAKYNYLRYTRSG